LFNPYMEVLVPVSVAWVSASVAICRTGAPGTAPYTSAVLHA
jgi:hypothetical protein